MNEWTYVYPVRGRRAHPLRRAVGTLVLAILCVVTIATLMLMFEPATR
jgi:hypothetical protein